MTELERLAYLLSKVIPVKGRRGDILRSIMLDEYESESLADFLIKNGVNLPPVHVGSAVYYIVGGYYKSPDNCKVSEPCKVVEISYKQQTRNTKTGTELRLLAGFITDNGTRYSFDGIGKTVFLTREEAEAELEKRRKEVNTT